MVDEVKVEFESRNAIRTAIDDATETLLDRLDTIANRYDMDDREMSQELYRIGETDLRDAWDEYVIDENYER